MKYPHIYNEPIRFGRLIEDHVMHWLNIGYTVNRIAREAGVTRATVYKYMRAAQKREAEANGLSRQLGTADLAKPADGSFPTVS